MRRLRLFALLLGPLVVVACRPSALSSVEVASGDGKVRAHAPAGEGWKCTANDEAKDTFSHSGVKCVLPQGLVLSAKVYEVEVSDARSAELFCIQDWKEAYGSLFTTLASTTSKVVDWRGVPACEVAMEGMTTKGPWRLWEIHAPNGRKMLQVSVSGSLPLLKAQQPLVDAWLRDLSYDLKLPGQ